MEEFVTNIIHMLLPAGDIYLYIFLFLSAIIENLFPPIPGDTITAFGAFLVGTGRLQYWIVYIVTTLGSVLGFMALFFLGRYLGKEFFMKKNYSFFSSQSILDAESWFQKYGHIVVLANRFLPGIRSVISIVSGISLLSPVKVFLYALVSASVWNLIWIQAGYTLGNNWETVKNKLAEILRSYNIAATIFMATAILIFLLYKRRKKRADSNSN
ncbi:MAG TPA: DedA family protein [Spirochaetota bacterium]|nr:DedA family protein [Spirochaetota bacterium]HPJ40356.1 DedA family protein [Spirochaetota bacterium]HPQ53905.1 DedA family protein [Spirochaetota bacterium]